MGRHSFYITPTRNISESTLSNQLWKLVWESGINFYAGTFKSDQKCPRYLIIKFTKTQDEVKELLIEATKAHILPEKNLNSEFTFLHQFFKLIWECGIGFPAGTLGNGLNWSWIKGYSFLRHPLGDIFVIKTSYPP